MQQGVQTICENGNEFKGYLNSLSFLTKYSAKNSLLIFLQNPRASIVNGERTWDRMFNRQVTNDELMKPIKIFAPTKKEYKYYKRDKETNEVLLDEDGNKILETSSKVVWHLVSVYDVSQTIGDPIKVIDKNMYSNVSNYDLLKNALLDCCNVPVRYDDVKGLANGYFNGMEIVVSKSLSELQSLSTLTHEVVHSKLHYKTINESGKKVSQDIPRNIKEIQAQAITYVVLNHYGVDIQEYSFDYIATWCNGKDPKDLINNMKVIHDTSKKLIESIDKNMIGLDMAKQKNNTKEYTFARG